jgi:hypothetical protein
MRIDWNIVCTYLVPVFAALVLMYSDVNSLKTTKVDHQEVAVIKLELREQLIKNTAAIDNLTETTKELKRYLSKYVEDNYEYKSRK